MKNIFLVMLFLVLCAMPVLSVSQSSYEVKKGDTLWDLSEKYYGTGYSWGKIYTANKGIIKDPDIIYPSQSLNIPGADIEESEPAPVPVITQRTQEEEIEEAEIMQEAEEETEEEEIEEAEAEGELVPVSVSPKDYMNAQGFIAPVDWKIDGMIIGEKDKKLLISAGDTVYVNIGKDKLNPGDKCMVFRKIGKIKDPRTGKLAGIEVHKIARIEITEEIGAQSSSARVILSFESMKVGDIVKIETE